MRETERLRHALLFVERAEESEGEASREDMLRLLLAVAYALALESSECSKCRGTELVAGDGRIGPCPVCA